MHDLRSTLTARCAGNVGARKQLEVHTIHLKQIVLGQPVTGMRINTETHQFYVASLGPWRLSSRSMQKRFLL